MTLEANNYAAVDLGSNSFHMLVARLEHGELRVLDRAKDMVRLAEGVSKKGRLDDAVRQRALDSLVRFQQLLQQVPETNVRVAATQSFRKLKHPGRFLEQVEQALGAPVEIIGGREEARLVYKGVLANNPLADAARLVIDIGGGSTELVIGQGETIQLAESLQYGCVVATRQFFRNGRMTSRQFDAAIDSVQRDLQEDAAQFNSIGYSEAVGTSGTIRAILSIAQQQGWCESTLTLAVLRQLRDRLQSIDKIKKLDLPGLSERRRPVIAGGLAILIAVFESLHIKQMKVSVAALREGLLEDMQDKRSNNDPRELTIKAFASRSNIDQSQAQRVTATAEHLLQQTRQQWPLNATQQQLLLWTCSVHEAGLSIAHSNYQLHSAYLLEHSDMPGFSQLDQRFMAQLARSQRRNIPEEWHDGLPERLHRPAACALLLLRLAVLLNRSRQPIEFKQFTCIADSNRLLLTLPTDWLDQHPLTAQDLQQEISSLERLNFHLLVAD